jgi:hypothetical protein
MKLKKDIILQMSEEKTKAVKVNKNILNMIFNKKIILKENLDFLQNSQLIIKNKNLYILVEGEKILIKNITIPKVNKKYIDETIRNELRYNFIDVESIIYSYSLIREYDNKCDFLVFCINCEKLSLLENYIGSGTVLKRIELIQFCFMNYFYKKIINKNYCFVFSMNNYYYYLLCCNYYIVSNSIFSNCDGDIKHWRNIDLLNSINKFIEENVEYNYNACCIYFSNIKVDEEVFKKYLKIPFIDLGEVSSEEIISFFKKRKR